MAIRSQIEWTEATWNPTTGCTKVSAGCKNCYAEAMTKRFENKWGKFSEIQFHIDRLSIPSKKKTPTVYFVNSMSDLFHKKIPDSFIKKVFEQMNENPQHTFQILTKRADRITELNHKLNWTPNIWLGVSIENPSVYDRIKPLVSSSAHIKFLSVEPLLASVKDIPLNGIDWVIVGGESGRKARPLEREWVIEIRNQCKLEKIPFFFKQWGGTNKKDSGRLLDGKEYNQMPVKTLRKLQKAS
ncbi:MAG: phage Gp37/Gp68 family protein [Leptospiraceae bacterium]|nr:phage Gp37/Gp68 family protein [Leptospiraceae bacterium]